jgi:predicted nucleic-acid-binding protein
MKKCFIDTNYFLRFLLKDDEKQFNIVYSLFQKGINGETQLFTSVIVFFEIYWVLSSFYKKKKNKIIEFLKNILKLTFIDFENKVILEEAIVIFQNFNLDLEDCYNLAYAKLKKANEFTTFDKILNKLSAANLR